MTCLGFDNSVRRKGENMDIKYDVIVIGAGPGGSSAAALLAKEGKKVLLVDKNKSAGGRMMGIHDSQGFNYEMFPIHGLPYNNSKFEHVLKRINKEDAVTRVHMKNFGLNSVFYFEDLDGEVTKWELTGGFDESFLKAIHVPLEDKEGIAKIYKFMQDLATMPEDEIKKLERTPSTDYIDNYGEFPGMFRTFALGCFCEGTLEMTCDMVPASEMVRLFQQQSKDGACRYYEYGVNRVFEVFADAVEEFGGTVIYESRVKSVDVEDGTVQGITLENGEKYTAPIVISTAGIRQTVLKLVGEDKFDVDYAERIKGLVSGLACVGYRYFLDAPVLTSPQIIYYPEGCLETYEEFKETAAGKRKPEKNYIYFGTTSLYPNCAPEGKQLAYAVMSCYADPSMDVQPYLDYIESKIRIIQPDLFDHIERREVMTPAQTVALGTDAVNEHLGGEAYGVANSIGQTGEDRPSAVSPIRGLYYAGNDAGGFGEGTHQAVDSGVNIADFIISQK